MTKCKHTIDELVNDLCPIKRVRSPKRQFLIWIGSIGVAVLGWVAFNPLRPDIAEVLRNPVFLIEVVLLHAAFILGAYHLFTNALPGLQKGRWIPRLATGFLGGWIGLLIVRGWVNPAALLGACHNAWHCVGQVVALNLIGVLLLVILLRRYPVSILGYALPGVLLSASLGTAVMEWTCQSMNPLHLLIGHGGPMVGMMILFYVGYRLIQTKK